MVSVLEGEVVPARPYALIIRATERCKVGCDHCCINATGKGQDMELSMAERVLQDASKVGIGLIHLSGGEPLLHKQLEEIIKAAADLNLYVELTTSTYTEPGAHPASSLARFKEAGLKRVMLSYDAAHARKVSIEQFAEFVCEAQAQDLEVCAVVVEWESSTWPMERVKAQCEDLGVNGDLVDWCRSNLSIVGRAENKYADQSTPSCEGARCPYVLTAPTLAPDGTVFLCPNLQSRSKLFQLGNVKQQPLDEILEQAQASRFYQSLSAQGPHKLSAAIGLPPNEVPADMCGCCQALLRKAEDPETFAKMESSIPEEIAPADLEVEALLPGHRRFVLGEERPETGCLCE
jgi:MoaA/NifB/PqqE/SkfB family radical SAM enzyme